MAAVIEQTDYFALLNEPRRPWIDPDRLKQEFLTLSAQAHPDRVHNAPEVERQAADRRYSELNAAYACLHEPKDRLRHLLELELGAKPADIQQIPPGAMDDLFVVGQLCRSADEFLAEKARVTAPLLKVQLFERAQEFTGKLVALESDINARRERLLAELRAMNPLWDAAERGEPAALPLERLEQIYRLLGYFARWSEQLQERVVQLSF